MHIPQKHLNTNDGTGEEMSNEIHSHHLDISRMPKDKDDSRIETVASQNHTKPLITKRNSSILAANSKHADSRISKSSNKDLQNVIHENKVNHTNQGSKIVSKTVSKNPSKHLVNQSINAQTPMIDGEAPKDPRTNSGLDVMTLNNP